MERKYYLFLLPWLTLIGCETKNNQKDILKWKAEIAQAEKDFNDMAADKGVAEAFLNFASDDAVLKRGKQLVMGKKAIKKRFEDSAPNDYQLIWKPDYVDVSASGDLGYTYGKYTYTTTDSIGNVIESEGIFHTVWKRQADGSWRFVWD